MKYFVRTLCAIGVFFLFIFINSLVNKLPDFFLWNIPIEIFNWLLPTICILYYFSIAANGILSTIIGIVLSAAIIYAQWNMINISYWLTDFVKLLWYGSLVLAALQLIKCVGQNISLRFKTEDFY